jgi:VWFA-related protein
MLSIRRFPAVALAALLLVAALPAAAQAPSRPDPADTERDPAAFGETIDVRVVNVEVVVEDKDGVRVTGLGPGDFRLVVDGEPVPVDFFTEIRGGEAVAAAAPGGEAPGAAVPSMPAAVPGEPVGTSYLVFIDDYFSLDRDRNRVLQAMIEDLPAIGPDDRMAVVAFNGKSVEMLATWTGSGRDLERAFQNALGRPALGLQRIAERRAYETAFPGRAGTAGTSTFGLDPQERGYARELGSQIERSVNAVVATLRGFAQPPGRKVMLLLSGGWPFSVASFVVDDTTRPLTGDEYAIGPRLFGPLTETANLLGYTVYPVDVPGLGGAFGADVEQGGRTINAFNGRLLDDPEARFTENTIADSLNRERIVEDALVHIAEQTGGEALINAEKLNAFELVVADTRSYYWLGFTPERQRDDREHEIRVEVTRPGLEVRTREGFRDMSADSERQMAVQSALLFGDSPAGELPVELGAFERAGRREIEVPVRVILPVGQMTALPTAQGHVVRLELRFAALDEQGGESEMPIVPITLTFEEPPGPNAAVPYDTRLRLRRERQVLVVSLHDAAGGRQLAARVEVDPR